MGSAGVGRATFQRARCGWVVGVGGAGVGAAFGGVLWGVGDGEVGMAVDREVVRVDGGVHFGL